MQPEAAIQDRSRMPPRVDFYVSPEEGEAVRLRLACRVTEKAYLAGQRVLVWSNDASLLPRFDDMLWTFADGSFVPHESVAQHDGECASPVALTTGAVPKGFDDVLVNLGDVVPPFYDRFARVAEFLDGRAEVRGAGRERFKTYRAGSVEPNTHTLANTVGQPPA
jgi:DNA polymerase III subunit chi